VARIVLDTDVVSLDRAGRLPAALFHQVVANDVCITFASAGELLWSWALARRWGGARRGGLNLRLDKATILPAGLATAKIWAAITTGGQRRGRPRPLNDTWIAACCIESGCRC
jgi:toxin FitB